MLKELLHPHAHNTLNIYSSHDVTLLGILYHLLSPTETLKWPDYGSYIIFEVYEDKVVCEFNGETVWEGGREDFKAICERFDK